MMNIHNTRIANATKAIANRLNTQSEVRLYARTELAESKIFRIYQYLNHYCGNYCYIFRENDPLIIVRKNGE